jgi:hypothetical protein
MYVAVFYFLGKKPIDDCVVTAKPCKGKKTKVSAQNWKISAFEGQDELNHSSSEVQIIGQHAAACVKC